MNATRTLFLLLCMAAVASAGPTVTAVQNAASNIPAGLPNAGIAQGSMFVIVGLELGPANFIVADTFPLTTVMSGTSVQVTVNGVTVDGILYYTGPTQVAVILPSSTPIGEGTVIVTHNGISSAPFPITVVASAFGVFSVSQDGTGDAIAFIGQNLVTPTNAANATDVVSFWGTGLTGVGFDETMAAQQFDMTDVPLEAFVGSVSANVLFRGRNACCAAVDVAYIEIPAGVAGCAVPVTFKIGNTVSNTTAIAIAADGRTCTPSNPGLAMSGNWDAWIAGGAYASGGISLSRTVSYNPPLSAEGVNVPANTTRFDAISGNFFRYEIPFGGAGAGSTLDIASHGACRVISFRGQIPPGFSATPLDAGEFLSITGPPGSWNVPRMVVPGSISYSESVDQTGSTFTPGTYTLTTAGGPEVGPISVALDVPHALVWTNQEEVTEIDRTQGVTLHWTGGDPNGYVQIQGYSFVFVGEQQVVSASYDCTARTSDGSFFLSPVVLLALPVTETTNIGGIQFPNLGTIGVNSFTIQRFNAEGIDYGHFSHTLSNGTSVFYK